VGIVLLLRDALARSLFASTTTDFAMLNRVLNAYEPAANRIRHHRLGGLRPGTRARHPQQQEAIRELSTPVLPFGSGC